MHPTTLLPLVERKKNMLVRAMRIIGQPIVVTSTVRTYEEQDRLYAQGRSAPGPIVTNARAGGSFHNHGVAFDVAFLINGQPSWDNNLPWAKVGRFGEILGLEWGGRWTTIIDRPHFQLTKGYRIEDFNKGQVNYQLFK